MLYTLALADDHKGLREMMAEGLEKYGRFKIEIQAGNGEELIESLERGRELPDVCIVDLKMPRMDGFETIRHVRPKYPHLKILVYSMFIEHYNILKVYKLGANGIFSKDLGLTELINAINQIVEEGLYIPPEIEPAVALAIKKHQISLPKLTEREIEFVRHCCEELTFQEIAQQMNITIKTVNRYKENVCEKLSIKSRTGIILFAMNTGLVSWK